MKEMVKFERIIDGNYHSIEREKKQLIYQYQHYKNVTKGELNLLGYIRVEVNAYFARVRSRHHIEKFDKRAKVVLSELVNEFDFMHRSDVRLCITRIIEEIYINKYEK
jgi:hypothetical protein